MAARIGAQYPGEKEITFPPFTCLESDGDPRVERSESGQGEIVIFPLKVTAAPRHHPQPPHPPPPTPPHGRLGTAVPLPLGISAARAEGSFATQGVAV